MRSARGELERCSRRAASGWRWCAPRSSSPTATSARARSRSCSLTETDERGAHRRLRPLRRSTTRTPPTPSSTRACRPAKARRTRTQRPGVGLRRGDPRAAIGTLGRASSRPTSSRTITGWSAGARRCTAPRRSSASCGRARRARAGLRAIGTITCGSARAGRLSGMTLVGTRDGGAFENPFLRVVELDGRAG